MIPKITPLRNKVLVHNMKRGERTVGRFIVANDDGRTHGIRPRWAQIYEVGPDVDTIQKGQWVLIDHGRWTRSVTIPQCTDIEGELRRIEYPESVLLVSDEEPSDETVLDSMEYGQLQLPNT